MGPNCSPNPMIDVSSPQTRNSVAFSFYYKDPDFSQSVSISGLANVDHRSQDLASGAMSTDHSSGTLDNLLCDLGVLAS